MNNFKIFFAYVLQINLEMKMIYCIFYRMYIIRINRII